MTIYIVSQIQYLSEVHLCKEVKICFQKRVLSDEKQDFQHRSTSEVVNSRIESAENRICELQH